ncbi:Protein TPX2 [Linum perenne]
MAAATTTIEERSTTVAATASSSSVATMIDEVYEYSAPRFFDFTREESDEEARKAELWFDTALTYAPSPFMPRIKTGRSFKVESMCDFTEADQNPKTAESSDSTAAPAAAASGSSDSQTQASQPSEAREEEAANKENKSCLENMLDARDVPCKGTVEKAILFFEQKQKATILQKQVKEQVCCTPKQPVNNSQKGGVLTDSKKNQSARHIASLIKNPSVLKSKSRAQTSKAKSVKPSSVKKGNVKTPDGVRALALAHENQAIKRQKLEDGKSRQILNVRPPQPLLHKSKLGISTSNPHTQSAVFQLYVREPATRAHFMSTAEMMQKFQSGTRDLSLSLPPVRIQLTTVISASQGKAKLTLTRPKEPAFETAQRVRAVRVKSSAELEEEMLAKLPKFKARPVNKKILQAPTLQFAPRSTPQQPEFQEFHLETTARANFNAESASVASTESLSMQNNERKPPHHLTEPKTPRLQTSLRARPTTVKSSLELEKEALEKMPKFKARPLNRKIFESRGELGIFCNTKKQVTVPREFHFAIDERIPPPTAVVDMFDKLSLSSECHDNMLPRSTAPNPFHLHTEDRGAEKERRLAMELVRKQMEDELARARKANPYPYTTDYPVVPPKPDPKPCTRPEPFQLESLVRHEQEMQKEMEERLRKEKEEAQMRVYKAQPILKEDPIPLPEKVRRPLTEVQKIQLHVDNRASNRAEFDQKVKEKEMVYKRYREESEAAKMIEEEKALKQLRRTMVPHARPVPNFEKPFLPHKSSKDATRPKSPRLRVLRRKENQKSNRMMMMGVGGGCSSTPASFMR